MKCTSTLSLALFWILSGCSTQFKKDHHEFITTDIEIHKNQSNNTVIASEDSSTENYSVKAQKVFNDLFEFYLNIDSHSSLSEVNLLIDLRADVTEFYVAITNIYLNSQFTNRQKTLSQTSIDCFHQTLEDFIHKSPLNEHHFSSLIALQDEIYLHLEVLKNSGQSQIPNEMLTTQMTRIRETRDRLQESLTNASSKKSRKIASTEEVSNEHSLDAQKISNELKNLENELLN